MLLSWLLSLNQLAIARLEVRARILFVISWVSIMVVFLIASYTYIILKVDKRRRKLNTSMPQTLTSNIKYHVPLLIVLSYILLVLVPTLIIVAGGFYMNAWIDVIYKTNYITDALIYLLNSARCRNSLKFLKTFSRGEKRTGSHIISTRQNSITQ